MMESQEQADAAVDVTLVRGCVVVAMPQQLQHGTLSVLRVRALEAVQSQRAGAVVVDCGLLRLIDSVEFADLRETLRACALLGAQAAGPAIVTILVDMVITTSLCIALSRLGPAAKDPAHPEMDVVQTSAAQAAKNALKGVAANPMPWAILSGAVVSAFSLRLPGPVATTVGLLADSASPVALFTIGAVLARSKLLAASGHAPAVPWSEVLPVAAIKLLLHPLLVMAVGWGVLAAGLPLDRTAWSVVVLVAALPSASNVSMLAERFGADNGRIARIILVSTAVAFITFSGAVAWLPKP